MLSLSYTWSKAIANTGIANADGPGLSLNNAYTDSTHPELDRARGGNDRRHAFSGTLVLGLPKFEEKGFFMKHVLGDWEATTIVQAGTGYPVTVNLAVPGLNGLSGAGNATERPDRIVSEPCTISTSNKTQWLNPQAFSINGRALGSNGTASRNVCDGPGMFQADASLYKNISLGPRVKVQLRFEVFNIFNTVNFQGTSLNLAYNAQNVVYDTGSADDGDAGDQRRRARELRAVQPDARRADDAARRAPDVLASSSGVAGKRSPSLPDPPGGLRSPGRSPPVVVRHPPRTFGCGLIRLADDVYFIKEIYVMQTKLTLRLEETLIVRAKAWARRRGISLSQTVTTLFEQLPGPSERTLSPWTRKLVGIAARRKGRPLSDAAARRAHLDHLAERHR